jgi:hypothetical protein
LESSLKGLVSAYKRKWVEDFGNVSTKELESFWLDMFKTFEATLFNNAVRRGDVSNLPVAAVPQPITTVLSAPMGAGKSTALMHYLKSMNKYYRALVVVQLIDTANEYEVYLNDVGCVAAHSKNGKAVEDALNSRILIITHSMLLRLIKGGTSDALFDSYDLIVIDEQICTYEHVVFSEYDINSQVVPTLKALDLHDEFGGVFAGILNEVSLFKSCGEKVSVLNKCHGDKNESMIDWSVLASALKEKLRNGCSYEDGLYSNLKNLVLKVSSASRQGRHKLAFLQSEGGRITYNIVVDYLPHMVSKVVLDGTAHVNDVYRLLQENIGLMDVKVYPKVRIYRNALISACSMPTGKSALTRASIAKPEVHSKLWLAKLVSRVRNMYKDDDDARVLFVVHKDNEAVLKKLLDENMAVTHWGRHIGVNDYRQFNKIVIYGLNHRPDNVYSAMYFSSLGVKENASDLSIFDMESSALASDVLQAINRTALRTVVHGGDCPKDVEVFIALPKSKRLYESMMKKIGLAMPAAVVKEKDASNPMFNLIVTKNENVQKLLKFLSARPDVVKVSDVYKSGCMTRDEWRTLINNKNRNTTTEELRESGWVLEKPTRFERQSLSMGNRAPYVFRRVWLQSPFSDESQAA